MTVSQGMIRSPQVCAPLLCHEAFDPPPDALPMLTSHHIVDTCNDASLVQECKTSDGFFILVEWPTARP